jgi:hypothetical protein
MKALQKAEETKGDQGQHVRNSVVLRRLATVVVRSVDAIHIQVLNIYI